MNETRVQIAALVFLLVPLPLVFYGVHEGADALWWAGIVLVILGGVIPPLTRYTFDNDGDEEEEKGGDEADEGGME